MEKKNYPTVLKYFTDGYGMSLAPVLMTCMERWLHATANLGLCPGEWDAEAMWHLCQLLRCVLKDEYGVDIDK